MTDKVMCGTCSDAGLDKEAEYKVEIVSEEGKFIITAFFCWACRVAFEWGQARPDSEVSPIGEGV